MITKTIASSFLVFCLIQAAIAQNYECECVPYYQCFSNNTINTNGFGLIKARFKETSEEEPQCLEHEVCCRLPFVMNKPENKVEFYNGCGTRNLYGINFHLGDPSKDESDYGEFPWVVAIHRLTASNEKVYRCTGSLIHPKIVLTAAHCMNFTSARHSIRAGEWNRASQDEMYEHRDVLVDEILLHPLYDADTVHYDAALLILSEELVIREDVNVVCLPNADYRLTDGAECIGSGWGKQQYGPQQSYNPILKRVHLPWVNEAKCESQLRRALLDKRFFLHHSFLCAGGVAGRDLCTGDGGAPLINQIPGKENRFYQIGIVVMGVGCKEGETPGVYTNVMILRDWIDDTFKRYDLEETWFKPRVFTPRFGTPDAV